MLYQYPRTDNQLRAALIAAGALDEVHFLEAEHSREDIAHRQGYRAGLEALAARHGIERTEQLPSRQRADVLPYGSGAER